VYILSIQPVARRVQKMGRRGTWGEGAFHKRRENEVNKGKREEEEEVRGREERERVR
jgi:hypothetical protein